MYDSETLTECAVAEFDEHGALLNPDDAVGELVNTEGAGYFQGYYNDQAANDERMRHGMYWSGDLAYRDADGWIYLCWPTATGCAWTARTSPPRRSSGCFAAPAVALVAVSPCQIPQRVGDQVMAAIVLQDDASLTPAELTSFLASHRNLPSKGWPRYVRVTPSLPSTATNKVLHKRDLIAQGATAGDGVLWVREERGDCVLGSLSGRNCPRWRCPASGSGPPD